MYIMQKKSHSFHMDPLVLFGCFYHVKMPIKSDCSTPESNPDPAKNSRLARFKLEGNCQIKVAAPHTNPPDIRYHFQGHTVIRGARLV